MFKFVRKSLAIKSIILLSGMLTGVLSVLALINIREDRKIIHNNSEQVCRRLSRTILTALEDPMLVGNQDLIQKQFNGYRDLPGIVAIHLLDEGGIIRRSTNPGLIAAPDASTHALRALAGQESFGLEKTKETQQAVFTEAIPIENKQRCYQCHGPEKKILGALHLSLDWEPTLAQARFFIRQNMIVALAGIMIIGALSFVFLFRWIIAPIKILEKGLEQVAQGDLAYKVDIKRSDEIGELTALFNKMTRDLSLLLAKEKERAKELERLNSELIQERNKTQNYLDIAAAILVVLDQDGRVGLINKKGCEILEVSENEIIGKDWIDNFIPKEERERVRRVFQDNIAGRIFLHEKVENSVITKNGQKKVIRWHNSVLKNEQGRIVGALSSGEDVTEQKKKDEQIQKKIQELEQFNKFVVGRELKMRELKEKIKKLEERLGQKK